MRKNLIAAATAAALVASVAPAASASPENPTAGQSSGASDALAGFGTPAYDNLSSESEGTQNVRETLQSSNWMSQLGQSSNADTPVLDAWVSGSTLPNSLNPVDLANREIVALSQMSSGDVALSAQGSSQLIGSWVVWALIVTAIGQVIELVMRGLRLAQ